MRFMVMHKVDALMGSNGVPSAVQMAQVAAESKTPITVLTPAKRGVAVAFRVVEGEPTRVGTLDVTQRTAVLTAL